MNKKRYNSKLQESIAGYILVAPSVLLFLVIGLFCVLFSLGISFFNLAMGAKLSSAKFVGLQHFRDFMYESPFLSEAFWSALKHNTIIAVCLVIFVIPLALIVALMLQQIKRGSKLLRTLIILPMVASGVAIIYVWTGLYQPDGTINLFLQAIGLHNLVAVNGWAGELNTALAAIIFMMIWGGIPGSMLYFTAGLQTLDPHLYEAAEIDGANYWSKLLYITWPSLMPMTVITVILTLSGAFQTFTEVFVMTGGGPAGATQIVNVLIYYEAFRDNDMGGANAMAWFVGVLTILLTLLSLRLFRERT